MVVVLLLLLLLLLQLLLVVMVVVIVLVVMGDYWPCYSYCIVLIEIEVLHLQPLKP